MIKRSIDISVAITLLILSAPVSAVAAIAVRLRMGSPILFRQQRIGLDDRRFEILKLRTMTTGSGDDQARLTALGKLLRSTSVDELPQLINVVRGDMSLVGPRPLLPQYLDRYSARQRRRHEVRPGITGLAQVSGRNSLSWPERLELDVRYVETSGLIADVRIMFRTAAKVLGRSGITSDGAPMQPFRGET